MPLNASRAYLDENLDSAGPVADFLRNRDIDVLAVSGRDDLESKNDEFHYQSARRMSRLLITRDLDFLRQRFPLATSPGVLVLHCQTEEEAVQLLARFCTVWCEVIPQLSAGRAHEGSKALVDPEGFRVELVDSGELMTIAGCFYPG